MKRLSFALVVFACASAAFGATRPSATTPARSTRPTVAATRQSGDTSTDTPSRTVTSRSATTQTPPQVSRSARAAISQPTTVGRAAKQSVISTGTKVAAATENTAVDQVCWGKFSGCMDSFCMLDNANGGRCICSDKNAEYDAILQEIQNLDDQSYQLATVGVERIEMGDAVDAVISKTDSVTKRVTADAAKSKRQSLDLSSWNSLDLDFDADAEDIFDFSSDGVSIANKTGDALYRAAAKLCNAQIPECKSQSTLMDLMYKQRVRSDCTAYENSLRAARTQSAQKLYAAQSAMREAALEQYRNANKYDLGQCTVQFKQCMQTTGGCGDDFTGCVDLAARANSMVGLTGNTTTRKEKTIKGTSSKIKISAETYDTLEAKKALCMTVTQQCVNVRDQVWDAFLREAAPQIKSAELIVESNLRTSCISNISNCFQKACHDTMDPNDPEGSYDMCLTRPDTLRSVCKVEIDPCEAAEPAIMDYVRARLKSMRVDSCTNEFKACLQSEDRCGEDYTQCIGLDTDTIVKMCPADKLTGCKYETYSYTTKSGDQKQSIRTDAEIYKELATIATGIFLNIDNNMLTACQKAANAAMIKVCGSTENCDELVVDNGAGTRSFKYEICRITKVVLDKNGKEANEFLPETDYVCQDSLDAFPKETIQKNIFISQLSGLIYWGNISYTQNNVIKDGKTLPQKEIKFTDAAEYREKLTDQGLTLSSEDEEVIDGLVFKQEIPALASSVQNAIDAIESDPTVQYCMWGRRFQGLRNKDGTIKQLGTVNDDGSLKSEDARFPNLTNQMRQIIANSALRNARANYMKKYQEEMERMAQDQVKAASIVDERNAKDAAKKACIELGNSGTLPVSDGPKANNAGKWIAAGLIIVAAAAITILSWGTGSVIGAALGAKAAAIIATTSIVAGAGGAGTLMLDAANNPTSGGIEAQIDPDTGEEIGYSSAAQWNFKEEIKTIPNYETGVCTWIHITTNCAETGSDTCKYWDTPNEETKEIKLISNN